MSVTPWTQDTLTSDHMTFHHKHFHFHSEDRNVMLETGCVYTQSYTSLTSMKPQKALGAMICRVQGQLLSCHPAVRSLEVFPQAQQQCAD